MNYRNHIIQEGFLKDSWKRLQQNPFAMAGLYVLSILIFCSIFLPMLTSATYYETHLSLKNTPPNSIHLFGTDDLGRSMFARIWWGARISLFVGITAALIDMCIGVAYGTYAALSGGKIEETMMRIADIFYSLPYLLVVILLTVVLGQGIFTIIIAMTLTGWINMARITRAETLRLKELDFVLAALSLGASKKRILLKHIIPNCFGTIITTMTLTIPSAIFTESFLSFLGLGVRAPIASWGMMASDGLGSLVYYPHRLFFPATFICITMLAFNLLGNGLRDAFDPRLR
ncbi:MAG: Oligopeptide transport system permease protein OppC [Chlamydiia bacterium]|nr:Oligopeptide transport system permease protein OppC [Chlamydiia bacterium]